MAAKGELKTYQAKRNFADTPEPSGRKGKTDGPVDDALKAMGLRRKIVIVVPGFPAALTIASMSDLVALVPGSFVRAERSRMAAAGGVGLYGFPLPVETDAITVSQMWHPRLDADPAHGWLRGLVLSVCRSQRAVTD